MHKNGSLYDCCVEFTADDNSLSFKTAGGLSVLDSGLVRDVREWPDAFLVRLRTQGILCIPKRGLDSCQAEAFRRLPASTTRPPNR